MQATNYLQRKTHLPWLWLVWKKLATSYLTLTKEANKSGKTILWNLDEIGESEGDLLLFGIVFGGFGSKIASKIK